MERLRSTYADIASLPFCAPIERSLVEHLIKDSQMQICSHAQHEIVHMAHQECTYMEIVVEGLLGVEQISEEGDIFSVASFGPRSIIGGNLIFSSAPRYPHTIVALQSSKVVRIKHDGLFIILSKTPDVLRLFLQSISDNTLLVNDRLSFVVHQTLRQRLVRYLASEQKRQNSRTIVLPVTKTRLAQILGASRTSVSRELSKMVDDGMIRMSKSTIVVNEII
ncbi:MAG TPA: Crp/Fnr family transcriptional regulator [Sphaerochaetaceae bacterium]|nr:Crp/Fnr family transcriptional regulator [Sphaerochaetaceae bacterium]